MHPQVPYHYGADDLGYVEPFLVAPSPLAATQRKRPIAETGCAKPDVPNSLKRLATGANSYENDRLAEEASAGRRHGIEGLAHLLLDCAYGEEVRGEAGALRQRGQEVVVVRHLRKGPRGRAGEAEDVR